MTDIEAEALLRRLESGDKDALAPLMVFCYPAIWRSLRGRILPDSVKDCAQATFLNIWKAVQDGRFHYQGVAEFFAYVKTIAQREAKRYYPREEQFPSVTGESAQWDPPAPEPAEQAVEIPLILSDLLDKALIGSARGAAARDLGLLKKMAFQSFYVDRLSQREIASHLNRYAAHLNVSVTEDKLNNWLSGGRILKTVVSYVVQHREEGLSYLMSRVLSTTNMTQSDREILRLHWCCGKGAAEIAAERQSTPNEIRKLLENGVAELVATIKKQLHDGRRAGV